VGAVATSRWVETSFGGDGDRESEDVVDGVKSARESRLSGSENLLEVEPRVPGVVGAVDTVVPRDSTLDRASLSDDVTLVFSLSASLVLSDFCESLEESPVAGSEKYPCGDKYFASEFNLRSWISSSGDLDRGAVRGSG